jgi:hypothetical protein
MKKLPKQIQALEDEANKMIAEQEKAETAPITAVEPPAPAPAPVTPAAVEPVIVDTQVQEHVEQPAPVIPESTPPTVVPSVPDMDERMSKLEHSYSVLEGKYRNEVPRLHNENRLLRDENVKLKNELGQALERTPVESFNADELLKDDPDGELIGSEFKRGSAKIASHIVNQKMKEVDKKLEELRNLNATEHVASFKREVYAGVHDFDILDASPDFNTWLKRPNGLSSFSIEQTLDDAIQRRDGKLVVSICNAYKAERGRAGTPTAPKIDVSRQIAPKTVSSSPSSIPANKTSYSATAFRKITDEYTRGKISKSEYQKHELEFNQAIADGRVVQ